MALEGVMIEVCVAGGGDDQKGSSFGVGGEELGTRGA